MDVLRFVSSDKHVEIKIATSDIRRPWQRFLGRVSRGSAYSYCDYLSTQEGTLTLADVNNFSPELDDERSMIGKEWRGQVPVMYETCDYGFSIRFSDIEDTPVFVHKMKEVADRFSYTKIDAHNGFLVGAIDFVNEPGNFALSYRYKPQGGAWHTETLTLPVVSPKLDVKNDAQHIMLEIDAEYNELVFQYLTKTFHNLTTEGHSKNDVVWLSIFRNIVQGYFKAVDFIINKPHIRVRTEVRYSRADRIKYWTPDMAERYYRAEKEKKLDETLFRHEISENTSNTRENRFVKYTLEHISSRLKSILESILANENKIISEEERLELKGFEKKLQSLQCNRLFRPLRGESMREESIVMQKRTGYAQVYRYWLMLQRGIELYEGSNAIGTRPVWELYELWCFLKLRQLVAKVLDIDLNNDFDKYTENKNTMMNPFTDSKVEHKISFFLDNGDIVDLIYQHSYSRFSKDVAHTATTINRPDFVLNITKAGSQNPEKDIVLTYLFDAKYKVQDDERLNNEEIAENDELNVKYGFADSPIPADINQMHRYRDAIYYGEQRNRYSSKEIIGAYILFAGRGTDEAIRNRYYWKSIETVNIGAFPLLPKEEDYDETKSLLYEHLQKILKEKTAYEQIKDSIPQKGLNYSLRPSDGDSLVLVGYAKQQSKNLFLQHKIYYTRAEFESGSLRLRPGFEWAKYLLLHDAKNAERRLYLLNEKGPRIVTKKNLVDLGFSPQHGEIFFVFDILDTENYIAIQEDVNLPNVKAKYDPYFLTFSELMKS